MEEWKVIGEAMKVLRDAFSLKDPQPVARFESDTDYEVEFGYDEETGEYTWEPCKESEDEIADAAMETV